MDSDDNIWIERNLLLTAAQAAFPTDKALSEKGRRIREGVHNLLAREDEEIQVRPTTDHNGIERGDARLLSTENQEKVKVKDPEVQSRGIPRVLTLKFSAEDYTGTHEACDGLVVEITEEIENSMTRAQRWSTFWRHNYQSPFEMFDLVVAGGVFAAIFAAWMFIERFNVSELKYGAIPAFVIAFAATLLKKLVSLYNWKEVRKFVSDHFRSPKSEQYGQQQTVISKIKFLKKESGSKPYWFFSFITRENSNKIEKTCVPKYGSAPHEKLRIIVFMDGLDRYEDTVMVQVLRCLNTVLKACEINFVLALDKNIIRKACKKEDDADHFISQIIQLPVTIYQVYNLNSEMQGMHVWK
ncbi:hypothetical protein SUGI_1133410 [Cryptomeria japonica]|nr:hypothetical protein SUGI_1133410 [Cryptomeria japonica]